MGELVKLFTSSQEKTHMAISIPDRHQTVIIGAGFGGLAAARKLVDHETDVVLIDQRNHHTFQPLLYQVATAGLDANDVCYPTRRIAREDRSLNAIQGTVVDVDFGAQIVHLESGRVVPYDSLVLALGGITADFGVPGVGEYAFGLKSASDAEALRERVLTAFESVGTELGEGRPHRASATTIVIVGGGPTGVELAGGYAELTSRVLLPDYPEIDPDAVRVVLIEGRDALLGGFASSLQMNALETLESMGVEVLLETQVGAVHAAAVELADGTEIPTDTVVWAAGIRAHPLAEALGLETGSGGRVVVDDTLRLPEYPNVYAIGDFAAATHDGSPLPQVAPVAIQAGEFVADRISETIASHTPSAIPFVYKDKGSMATIGRNAAVVELPNGFTMRGFPGWVAWLALHLIMLMGFRNRASVFVKWAWNYITYDRGSRAIIEDAPARAVEAAPTGDEGHL